MNEIKSNNTTTTFTAADAHAANAETAAIMRFKQKHPVKKVKREENFIIPTQLTHFTPSTYTLLEMKTICRHYKLRVTGNKTELSEKIKRYLLEVTSVYKIQKIWRTFLYRKLAKAHGPARFKRQLCVNETDFCTMDDLAVLPFEKFFSFQDTDNIIYGFDVSSLHTLLQYNAHNPNNINPYNRRPIPIKAQYDVRFIIFANRLFAAKAAAALATAAAAAATLATATATTTAADLPIQQLNFDVRNRTLFNAIDDLGNYTNNLWFANLTRSRVIRFIVDLYDIWTYRANLSHTVKQEICPQGSPYDYVNLHTLVNYDLVNVRTIALTIMETIVYTGINTDSKMLGANFVLCALTLNSPDAAHALPWLYESVV
jgi:hypothetical protein